VLDKDCCPCTVAQVADSSSAYFKGILEELVETPLFRLYAPYPGRPGAELYDVECSVPEFHDLEQQLSASQLGCAIEQCGCQEAECANEQWRREPCFIECEDSAREREDGVLGIGRVTPADSDGVGPVQYDLVENPEQFTGYGTLLDDRSARMIWDNLYTDRFCFASCPEAAEREPSVEKRLVYKVVSGLQASINTHIAMHYGLYADSGEPATLETWGGGRALRFGPWRQLFDQRVGAHPDRVRNMHFVFALLLRATHRLRPYLGRVLEAGRLECPKCASQHNSTQELLHRLLSPMDGAPEECGAVLKAFDYSALFAAGDDGSLALLEEVRSRFERMGSLMTCVGCDRCKLWGTLQFHAARVAVGILTSDADAATSNASLSSGPYSVPSVSELKPNDIVALVNALAQVSKSIYQAKEWMQQVPASAEVL
jgi:ERO1-like protein alpha